jgi:hypothetical protein
MPIQCFRALWNPSLTKCPSPFPTDSYQKHPAIFLPEGYDATKNAEGGVYSFRAPGNDMVAEAEVYEILKQHPHPNICIYHGSIHEGGYLVAICLKKYPHLLHNAVESGISLQCNIVLDGILEGLLFLHTLGFAYNDVNMPVIIDFNSCIQIGQDHRLDREREALLDGYNNWSQASLLLRTIFMASP